MIDSLCGHYSLAINKILCTYLNLPLHFLFNVSTECAWLLTWSCLPQVYVRIKDEEWNVYKRYKQFNDLQSDMKKKYPLTAKFDFPPKKSFGKKVNEKYSSR